MRVVGPRSTHAQTHTHTGQLADSQPASHLAKRRRITPTPLEARQVVPNICNSYGRHLAEWFAQWEGIFQGTTRLQDFPGVPARRNTRHLAGEVGKAHASTIGTTTTHGSCESTKRGKSQAAAGTAADDALEGDTSGDTEETLSEYEQQRLTRIARNNTLMVSLGIDSVQTLTLPRGGAPTSKPVPATTPGSGVSTK